MKTTRPYEMRARAESTAATRARLIRAVIDTVIAERTFAVTLNAVAARAGISVQTALRQFGSREALIEAATEVSLAEVRAERTPAAPDAPAALRALLGHYERLGDFVIGVLGEEDREPRARAVTDVGRAEHRRWVAEVFATELGDRDPADHEAVLDLLVVATDVYAWKLLRRDRGLSPDVVHDRMCRLTEAVVATAAPATTAPATTGPATTATATTK